MPLLKEAKSSAPTETTEDHRQSTPRRSRKSGTSKADENTNDKENKDSAPKSNRHRKSSGDSNKENEPKASAASPTLPAVRNANGKLVRPKTAPNDAPAGQKRAVDGSQSVDTRLAKRKLDDMTRSSSSSNGRAATTSPVKRVADAAAPSAKRMRAETAPEIAERYARLRDLRETQVEQELREYKAAAQERIDATEELLNILRDQKSQEVVELQENIDNLQGDLQAAHEEIDVLRAKLRAHEDGAKDETKLALGLCSDMSGVAFKSITTTKDETAFEILQSGRNGTFHYTLATSTDDEGASVIRFTPLLDDTDDELVSYLPEYFTESLTFARDAVSSLYSIFVLVQLMLTADPAVFLEDMPGAPGALLMTCMT